MIFIQTFYGVPNEAIYPVVYQPGDECPPELVSAAQALGVLAGQAPATKPTHKKSTGKAK